MMTACKLLFIHGAGGTKNKWRSLNNQLGSARFEAIDLPGHGENKCNIITSIQDYASFVSNEITEDTIVVGHSMGGLVALELAVRNNRVKAIVLVASFYELPVHEKLLEKLSNGEYPKSLFNASYSKQANEVLIEEEREELKLVPVGVTSADFRATNEYRDGKDILANLSIPVCAIVGTEDRLIPQNAVEALKELKSDISIYVIDGAGHYPMLENPERFSADLLQFASSVRVHNI